MADAGRAISRADRERPRRDRVAQGSIGDLRPVTGRAIFIVTTAGTSGWRFGWCGHGRHHGGHRRVRHSGCIVSGRSGLVQALGLSFSVSTLALAVNIGIAGALTWSLAAPTAWALATACIGMRIG